jgi:hypothetical protein
MKIPTQTCRPSASAAREGDEKRWKAVVAPGSCFPPVTSCYLEDTSCAKRTRARAGFVFSSCRLQAKPRAAGCTRAPVFLLLFTGAAQGMLCLKQVRRLCARGYLPGRAFALRSGAASGVRLPSTSTAACSQVRAISSKTWRCRSDLLSPAQRKHSCANSRNSAGDDGMCAPASE